MRCDLDLLKCGSVQNEKLKATQLHEVKSAQGAVLHLFGGISIIPEH